MKHALVRSIALCCLIAAATAAPAAVNELTEVVPAGSPFVSYTANVQKTLEHWDDSPLAGLWNDPQVAAFFAPLRAEMEIEHWDEHIQRETGHSLDEIKGMLTGDLVFYVEDLSIEMEKGAEDADFAGAVLATVGDHADDVEAILLSQQARLSAHDSTAEESASSVEAREFRGVELHLMDVADDGINIQAGWAIVDGILVLASPVESLERAVAAILDDGADPAIESSTNFASIASHTEKAESWVFVNMAPLVPVIHELAETAAATAQEAGSPFPIDPASVVQGLGVDAMQAVFATFSFDDRAMVMDFGLSYTDNRGLVKLLAYGPGAAPRPAFIGADTDTFTTVDFNYADAWAGLVEIVNGINPALTAMAAMQLQSVAQNAGVEIDLKRDLLDNLTGETVTIQNFAGISGTSIADLELQQDQVIVFGIAHRAALENAIAGIMAIAGQGSELFNPRTFEEHTIATLDLGQEDDQTTDSKIEYAITDENLLISIGSSTTLEATLRAMDGGRDSVWKQRKVKRALATLPSGASAIQYQDPADLGDLIFRGIAMVDGVDVGDGEDIRICDPEALPDPGIVATYFSSAINGVWKDDRQLVIRARVLPAAKK